MCGCVERALGCSRGRLAPARFVTPIAGENAMGPTKSRQATRWARVAGVLAPAVLLLTGCQVEMGGQTLPSPWYLTDDVQYYTPGPEFKLAREAAAMEEQAAAIESERQEAINY